MARRSNPLRSQDREMAAYLADLDRPDPRPIPGLRMVCMRTIHPSQAKAMGLGKVQLGRRSDPAPRGVGLTVASLPGPIDIGKTAK